MSMDIAAPLIESAAGVLHAAAVCAVPGVIRPAFGSVDLAAQLGVSHDAPDALWQARSALVLAAAASGRAAPVDGVTTAITDERSAVDDRHDQVPGRRALAPPSRRTPGRRAGLTSTLQPTGMLSSSSRPRRTAHSPERLGHPGQLRPPQVEQGTRHQLGHPAADRAGFGSPGSRRPKALVARLVSR